MLRRASEVSWLACKRAHTGTTQRWNRQMATKYYVWMAILYSTSQRYCNEMPLISLQPSDAALLHKSGSPLVQVMVCCLTTPTRYLNQSWLTIKYFLGHTPEGNFIFMISITFSFEIHCHYHGGANAGHMNLINRKVVPNDCVTDSFVWCYPQWMIQSLSLIITAIPRNLVLSQIILLTGHTTRI